MKVRSLISIVVASLALMLVGIISAQELSPRVWLSSGIEQATAGQEFTVTINVADAVGVYGGSFKLAYDPQALEVVLAENKAVVPGAFFNTGSIFTLVNTADAGTIDYAMTLTQPAEPVNGAGALGTVTFRALSNTAVSITPVEVRLLSPEFTEVNGRKIAQRIDEVAIQIEGMTINAGNAETASVQPPDPTPEMRPLAALESAPAAMPVPMPRSVLVIGAALFVVGLLLFAASIGIYVNLRRQFLMQEQSEQLIW